jgi:hypothetical protein
LPSCATASRKPDRYKDLGPAHQLLDLLLQLRLGFEHPLVAHRFVLRGIGLHLGAFQRHMAQAHHAALLAEAQDLHKQLAQGLKVAAAELIDPGVVRLLVAGQHPESQILVAGALDPTGRDDACAVGVEQKQRHHPRVKPLLPAGILALGWDQDRRQIEQEIHLMVSGQPVTR